MKKTLQHIHRFEIRLSGLGGQGIITLGRLLGASLALGHGYHVTQTQSYGPEARGGSSRADVVISSSPISYPKTENLDLLVALSQEACNNYYRYMKRAGVLLVDTTLVQHTPTNHFLGLPFTRMAREKIGNPLTINTLVLGAVTHLLPFAERRLIRKSLEENLPPKIQAINVKAFNLGLRQAARHFGEAPEIWKLAKDQANAAEEQETD
ncbi:2-oxoacid:acceptor oxidoreductase family protein [Oleidesulfovibrio alaskensis]|jgi:2-oxoglutarate ferredoxin oxidoreductase subunit gamma|uniref:2-oxoacid:acceptor oxidoreductase family protein n=1 Tax=Oleidesulfovibrio alaskensis TaxID=58180 RepID=UPI001A4A05F3|nr:2-oxoacid:acceptor oxidoreductase family protein [Oleidesulfovibrio alaskensis]MBL3583252.1 2-oxoacid:acceptor oxidoreductase family protein [Oleidesulfovibrio alaskensis]